MSFDPNLPNGGGVNPPNYPGPQGYPPAGAWSPTGAPPPHLGQPPKAGKAAPKKYWYAIGALLMVAGVVVAGVVGVGSFIDIIGGKPTTEHTFSSGGKTTVHIDAGASKVVFVANAGAAGPHNVHCNVTNAAGQQTAIQKYESNLTLNEWKAYFTVPANESGDYTIACTGADSDTFGIGESAGPTAWVMAFGGIFGGGLLAVAGLVTTIVVAILRHRRLSRRVT